MITLEATTEGKELEKEVDGLIEEFRIHFRETIDEEPLLNAERAIIKTFMHYCLVTRKRRQGAPREGGSG